MDLLKEFGQNIKKYRELRNLTQEKLAELIDAPTQSISVIEIGKNFVSAKRLIKLCDILKVSPSELFNFSLDNKSSNEKERVIKNITNLLDNYNEKELSFIQQYLLDLSVLLKDIKKV